MKKRHTLFVILLIALIPSTVQANVSAPLLLLSFLYLFIGNSIIGVCEWFLLALIFRKTSQKSILLIIAANYISAWIGYLLLHSTTIPKPYITIENIHDWLFIYITAAFALTLIIEFPFIWLSLKKRKNRLLIAVIATIVIQGISYFFLFGFFSTMSDTTLMTELKIVNSRELIPPQDCTVFYLSPDGSKVLKRKLNENTEPVTVQKVSSNNENNYLFTRPGEDSRFDLFLCINPDNEETKKELLIQKSFASKVPQIVSEKEKAFNKERKIPYGYGIAPSMATNPQWEFRNGRWPREGIVANSSNHRLRYNMDTPFTAWTVHNPNQLEGDYLIFQLGDNQICIIHPEKKQISLICLGRRPLVAIE